MSGESGQGDKVGSSDEVTFEQRPEWREPATLMSEEVFWAEAAAESQEYWWHIRELARRHTESLRGVWEKQRLDGGQGPSSEGRSGGFL